MKTIMIHDSWTDNDRRNLKTFFIYPVCLFIIIGLNAFDVALMMFVQFIIILFFTLMSL